MSKGLFISFEGGEGSGKTTQIKYLVKNLKNSGYEVFSTREPGGTPEAENIRNLLVDRDGGDWNAMSEVLLLFAARSMHIEKVIKAALKKGMVVICDRFTDSTIAYQGYGRGLEIDKIRQIEKISIDNFTPDLTFILDIDVRKGLERSIVRLSDDKSTEDRFERMDIGFHEKLRLGFLDIAAKDTNRCFVINADLDVESIAHEISSIVIPLAQLKQTGSGKGGKQSLSHMDPCSINKATLCRGDDNGENK